MFYLIGLGINGWKGISVLGLEACKSADYVFIERFTNIIRDEELKLLEENIKKKVVELSRDDVEMKSESVIIDKARDKNACLIVGGDPLTATTHIELIRLCKERKVDYKIIHSSSIYNSVCETGLHAYRFGKSTSIPYPEKNYKPTSFFDIIESNYKNDSHTLVFLDIKTEKNKYMNINEGLQILLDVSAEKNGFINLETKVFAIARLGYSDQLINYGAIKDLIKKDFGANPHVIVIPKLSKIEKEYVDELFL